jgi:hypothetical protein
VQLGDPGIAELHAASSRDAVSKRSRTLSRATQSRLRDTTDIINRVTDWAGSVGRAFAWFRSQPLPSFGDKTAEDLVKEGRAQAGWRWWTTNIGRRSTIGPGHRLQYLLSSPAHQQSGVPMDTQKIIQSAQDRHPKSGALTPHNAIPEVFDRLMLLPAGDPGKIRLIRVPEDFQSQEAFRRVTGLIAQVEESDQDCDWEDLQAVLEENGFEALSFDLGPSLDICALRK